MNNEIIIEKLLDKAFKCYKRAFVRNCPMVARMLDRKEPVEIDGTEYTCWRELIIVTCGNIINDYCPDAEIEVEMNGNDSTIKAVLSDADEKILQTVIKDMVA